MRSLIRIMILLVSIALGIYVGACVMLIGGIVQAIEAAKNNWDTWGLAIGIVRIVFCEIAVLIPIVGLGIRQLIRKS